MNNYKHLRRNRSIKFGIFDQDLAVCQSAKVFSKIMQKNLKFFFSIFQLINLYVEHNKKLFLLNLDHSQSG